ncbi:hypothetical protein D1155_09755 [Anaerotruncus sp. 80]|uniref:Uncharacterized protein n=1 Tax=Anaerotruncus colihominis TaxID=169435 RepID=A0A845QMI1_9FIRM|nr:hypothetical protein [Anaerotruncus colihominis]NCF02588.1 hypothetical protein [Anaerotruncus sp. 80]
MEERELELRKKLLIEKISRNPDRKYGQNDKTSAVWKNYALASPDGKCVYQSFSDEELLAYLRRLASELGYGPTQGEVFWVLKDYIKQRFGKWPYALRAAGLSASAGKGGKTMEQMEKERLHKEKLLDMVREKALELGKIPHPRDLPEVCREIKKYYSGWTSVIKAAKLDADFLKRAVYKIPDLELEYINMLEAVRNFAHEIGRSPLHGEIEQAVKQALIERCGSWRNALFQIDLEPVLRMEPFHDIYIDHRMTENRRLHSDSLYGCYYKVLNLDEDDRKRLGMVKDIYLKNGKIPMKKEVPRQLRQDLHEKCGSWGNVLYQIGVTPKEYYEEKNKKKNSNQGK